MVAGRFEDLQASLQSSLSTGFAAGLARAAVLRRQTAVLAQELRTFSLLPPTKQAESEAVQRGARYELLVLLSLILSLFIAHITPPLCAPERVAGTGLGSTMLTWAPHGLRPR